MLGGKGDGKGGRVGGEGGGVGGETNGLMMPNGGRTEAMAAALGLMTLSTMIAMTPPTTRNRMTPMHLIRHENTEQDWMLSVNGVDELIRQSVTHAEKEREPGEEGMCRRLMCFRRQACGVSRHTHLGHTTQYEVEFHGCGTESARTKVVQSHF